MPNWFSVWLGRLCPSAKSAWHCDAGRRHGRPDLSDSLIRNWLRGSQPYMLNVRDCFRASAVVYTGAKMRGCSAANGFNKTTGEAGANMPVGTSVRKSGQVLEAPNFSAASDNAVLQTVGFGKPEVHSGFSSKISSQLTSVCATRKLRRYVSRPNELSEKLDRCFLPTNYRKHLPRA